MHYLCYDGPRETGSQWEKVFSHHGKKNLHHTILIFQARRKIEREKPEQEHQKYYDEERQWYVVTQYAALLYDTQQHCDDNRYDQYLSS